MYEAFWGFSELPFLKLCNRPASRMHEEAICRIVFLLESNHPLAILTGKKGTGKTRLLQQLKKKWKNPHDFSTLHVDFDIIPIHEVGSSLLAQSSFRNVPDKTQGVPWTLFQKSVRENIQKKSLVIFDHVSAPNDDAFGIVKYLYHLAQQPEFRLNLLVVLDTGDAENEPSKFDRYLDLSPLQNEIEFLTHFDTMNYIQSSLELAGSRRKVFDEESLNAIFNSTGGQIGRINQLCDVCLLAGMLDRRKTINEVIVHAAAAELWPEQFRQFRLTPNGNKMIDDIVFPEDVSRHLEKI